MGTALALAALPALARAGDYHTDGTLACSQCHVMHYSRTHGYTAGSQYNLPPYGAQRDLLIAPANQLCATCHDGLLFAPDVIGINTGAGAALRLGGSLNWVSDPLSVQGTGHTLDSSNPPPGGSYTPANGVGLSCIDCHDPHGSAGPGGVSMYRNLAPVVGTGSGLGVAVTYSVHPTTPDLTKDVWERAPASYDESMVEWCEPNPSASAIARWCSGCHGFYHDSGSTPSQSIEHESFKENLEGDMYLVYKTGYPNGTGSPPKVAWVKVMSRLGFWNGAAVNNDATPTCITCHKAHGSTNPHGLIYRRPTLPATENGSGTTVDDLCAQCHAGRPDFFQAQSQPALDARWLR